jgi:hypothetical protein
MRGCLAAMVVFGGCVQAPQFAGPLPVRNQHPAQLTVLHMNPATARSLAPGTWSARTGLAYTNMFLSGTNDALGAQRRTFRMDGEYLRADLTARLGLGSGFEFEAELPVAHTSGGFLDGFVIDYHDVLSLPDQGRESVPRDQFVVDASRGDEAWAVERSTLELLDVPLALRWQVPTTAPWPAIALRTAVELPTGDAGEGYGSGELDLAVGAVLEYQLAGIGLYGHAQHTWAGTPQQARAAGFSFADVTSAGLGAEVPLLDGLAGIVQVELESSTLRDLGLATVARDQALLWLGGRLTVVDGWAMELAIGEDLIGYVSPDFTLWLGFTMVPRRGRGGGP